MIQEQLQALGQVLHNLPFGELVNLSNKVNEDSDRIYKVSDINKDFKNWKPLDLIKATNQRNFKVDKPYFVIAVSHYCLENEDYNIFVSIDKDDIDTECIAEAIFDGGELPINIRELLAADDIIQEYKYELSQYLMKKSGATEEQVEAYLDKVEITYDKDWFDLYCGFLSIL